MKFIDSAIIEVTGGKGGKGCISFRREKYVPRGGPDGGSGGKGGDVTLEVSPGLTTLMDFHYQHHFRATRGWHGKGKNMHGREGDDVLLKIPPGTTVYDVDTGDLIIDLTRDGERFVAARGGRGGRGNAHFVSATRQAPMFAQPGEEGENRRLRLELKLLADVGLIGMPNAGKSSLLSVISHARPKIADYPFTTLAPQLGVVAHRSFPPFTVADIPGLIEGAHEGHGLGIQFLKHIERTRVFVHLIALSPDESEDALTRYKTIRAELLSFDSAFEERAEVIVLTKTDLLESKKALNDVVKKMKRLAKPVFGISCVTREGIDKLLEAVAQEVAKK